MTATGEPRLLQEDALPVYPAGPSRLVWLVALLGAAFSLLGALSGNRDNSSVLWFLDPLLFALLLGGMALRSKARLPLWRPATAMRGMLVFVSLSWLTAGTYELALRTGETGFGGLHPDTLTSFTLALGYYIPLAIAGWRLLRRFHYDFNWVFWTGALAALYEMATIGISYLTSGATPAALVPFLLGYYLTVYAMFLALPLLIIDERALWSLAGGPISPVRRVVVGVAVGLLLWLVYLGWSVVVLQVM